MTTEKIRQEVKYKSIGLSGFLESDTASTPIGGPRGAHPYLSVDAGTSHAPEIPLYTDVRPFAAVNPTVSSLGEGGNNSNFGLLDSISASDDLNNWTIHLDCVRDAFRQKFYNQLPDWLSKPNSAKDRIVQFLLNELEPVRRQVGQLSNELDSMTASILNKIKLKHIVEPKDFNSIDAERLPASFRETVRRLSGMCERVAELHKIKHALSYRFENDDLLGPTIEFRKSNGDWLRWSIRNGEHPWPSIDVVQLMSIGRKDEIPTSIDMLYSPVSALTSFEDFVAGLQSEAQNG